MGGANPAKMGKSGQLSVVFYITILCHCRQALCGALGFENAEAQRPREESQEGDIDQPDYMKHFEEHNERTHEKL